MMTTTEKMEKMEYLKKGYKVHVLTDLYVKGFELNGIIYAYIDKGLTCTAIECEASKDGGLTVLKYKPTKKEKTALIKSGKCFKVCCSAYLEWHYKNSKYNRGDIFEKMILEMFGQIWKKDNVPFFEGYDLETGIRNYSIKYQGGRYCTEKTINKLNELYPNPNTYEINFVFEFSRGGYTRFNGTYTAKDSTTAITKAKNDFFAVNEKDGIITDIRIREI